MDIINIGAQALAVYVRTLGVVLKPVIQMLDVATMLARLTPGEPVAEFRAVQKRIVFVKLIFFVHILDRLFGASPHLSSSVKTFALRITVAKSGIRRLKCERLILARLVIGIGQMRHVERWLLCGPIYYRHILLRGILGGKIRLQVNLHDVQANDTLRQKLSAIQAAVHGQIAGKCFGRDAVLQRGANVVYREALGVN